MRAILATIKRDIENGYTSLHMLMDVKEVVQTLNGDFDWAINPIIVDIKKLILNFLMLSFP